MTSDAAGNPETTSLQLVPETVLRKKHDMDEMKARRAAQSILNPRGNRKVFNQKTKAIRIHKPESILSMARSRRNHAIRSRRVKKKGMQKRASNKKEMKTKTFIPDGAEEGVQMEDSVIEGKKDVKIASNSVGAKMVFCIRIRDNIGMPTDVRRVLHSFRLKNQNEGVFLQYNDTTRKALHTVEPWVTYGKPSKSSVSDLLKRRGHLKLDGERVPMSDNTLVEKAMSDYTDGAVICVQDLEYELLMPGEYFSKINKSLWPFCLAAPRSKFQKRKLNFKDGGDYGDRGEEIDDLIQQML
mmetsp:Transcript_3168/g.4467  ORF Transcript_3168/g.4467 Transcript_3168/m.4467 type:complete len:298 (-) Transcript_3168:153-1046(-)|eukprot:CAMPEP_0184858996 /NCGR_PEP_ID=MMETSP0580-20130426/4022_1 /TAXON_ID=1118495 /ORGANISM="Dactyliosolen fragilissimus" /LENGTH=297 /DNA_ID=CAMNT_0027355395 /DNA_START=144 /DNA_END=1037 /DNA_ORIENTATION=-